MKKVTILFICAILYNLNIFAMARRAPHAAAACARWAVMQHNQRRNVVQTVNPVALRSLQLQPLENNKVTAPVVAKIESDDFTEYLHADDERDITEIKRRASSWEATVTWFRCKRQ